MGVAGAGGLERRDHHLGEVVEVMIDLNQPVAAAAQRPCCGLIGLGLGGGDRPGEFGHAGGGGIADGGEAAGLCGIGPVAGLKIVEAGGQPAQLVIEGRTLQEGFGRGFGIGDRRGCGLQRGQPGAGCGFAGLGLGDGGGQPVGSRLMAGGGLGCRFGVAPGLGEGLGGGADLLVQPPRLGQMRGAGASASRQRPTAASAPVRAVRAVS
jgi:hypothetical protein